MEHANKAIIMAFGMLVAVMILGTIVWVFTKLKVLPMQDDDADTIEQRRLFNQEYEVYDKKIMYGVDIISVLNKAQSNNEKYVQGNFLSGNLYNTDYIINVVVNFNKELQETIEVTYLENGLTGVSEIQYASGGPIGIMAKSVFKAPKGDYQHLVYGSSNYWNSLKLEATTISTGIASGATKASPKSYQLLGGATISKPDSDGTTHYTNAMLEGDSVLKQLLTQSTTMSQTAKNSGSNKYTYGEGWNRATWYPVVYSMKTRRFKCEGDKITYSPKTGRIVYMEFTEV